MEAIHPGVEWRGGASFEDQPYRSLVQIDDARRILGWTPKFTWNAYLDSDNRAVAETLHRHE